MTKKEQQIQEFETMLAEAHAAGLAASKDVPDKGAVGWAWVNLPANIPFGRWLKKQTGKVGHYPLSGSRGTRIDSEYPGQAIAGQMAYADGVARYLRSKGIDTFSWQKYD